MLTDDNPPKIRTDVVDENAINGKFKNYVRRRSEAERFMREFDGKIEDLDSELDDIILALRRKGVLDYAGAVEFQSNNARKLSWTSGMGGPLYKNMSYAEGLIWCQSTNSSAP